MWESITTTTCDTCHCSSSRLRRSQNSLLDKENMAQNLSPTKNDDISFYGNSSPTTTSSNCTGTSPSHCHHNIIRRPLEDHDQNSRDSGYLTNYSEECTRFVSYASSTSITSSQNIGSFNSGSLGSMDDEIFEDFSDLEPLDDNVSDEISNLLKSTCNSIFNQRKTEKTTTTITTTTNNINNNNKKSSPKDLVIRPMFCRALSLQNDSPSMSRVRSCLFRNDETGAFKRPDRPVDCDAPINIKKARISCDSEEESSSPSSLPIVPVVPRPVLKRAFSATEESIMCAVQRSSTEPDLIGDFSKTFCLPLVKGRHQDLKSITPKTLAELMRGVYEDNVASFKVIDCRYPYEFDGGHIEGAINIYTKDQCLQLLTGTNHQNTDSQKRNILVFHCEFSSERGPNLYRYLREQDRQLNQESYPSLHYPEIYLLEGGYKDFFEQFSHLCVPIAYKKMLHPEHENDLRFFRQKSKTWNIDTRHRPQRTNLKKLGL